MDAVGPAVAAVRQQRVDAALDRYFSLARQRAAALGERYAQLWEALEASTRGGKRFRPRMVLGAYAALGGEDDEAAASVGAAFELLHTALIVHDDVIDRDFTRRGMPNIAGVYRDLALLEGADQRTAEHRGVSAAVIAGDLALSGAHRLVEQSGVPEAVRARLFALMDQALFASAAGELIDVEFAVGGAMPDVDDILSMERLKTAVYSFECPLQAGAILAGASDCLVDTLGEFGREIGIAYQIVDDVLGVFGREEQTGKTTIGDLREGKRTVMVAYATATPAWQAVADLFGREDLTETDAAILRTALVECGARDFAEGLARYYGNRALARLSEAHVPEALKAELAPVAESVLGRQR